MRKTLTSLRDLARGFLRRLRRTRRLRLPEDTGDFVSTTERHGLHRTLSWCLKARYTTGTGMSVFVDPRLEPGTRSPYGLGAAFENYLLKHKVTIHFIQSLVEAPTGEVLVLTLDGHTVVAKFVHVDDPTPDSRRLAVLETFEFVGPAGRRLWAPGQYGPAPTARSRLQGTLDWLLGKLPPKHRLRLAIEAKLQKMEAVARANAKEQIRQKYLRAPSWNYGVDLERVADYVDRYRTR